MPHVIKKLPMGVTDKAVYYGVKDGKANWSPWKADAKKYDKPHIAEDERLRLKHRACVQGVLEVVPV